MTVAHPIFARGVTELELDGYYYPGPEPEEHLARRLRAMPNRAIGFQGAPVEISFGAFLGWAAMPSRGGTRDDMWAPITGNFDRLVEVDADSGSLAATGLSLACHQVAGHSCGQSEYLVRPVAIAPDMIQWATALCAHYYHFWGGWFYYSGPDDAPGTYRDWVTALHDYRERLGAVGLSADEALGDAGAKLCEAIYPIDATDENLRILLADAEGEMLALGRFAEDPELRRNMVLLLLAENSD